MEEALIRSFRNYAYSLTNRLQYLGRKAIDDFGYRRKRNCSELIRQLSERGVSVRGWCVPSALIIAHEVDAYEPALNSDRVGAEDLAINTTRSHFDVFTF